MQTNAGDTTVQTANAPQSTQQDAHYWGELYRAAEAEIAVRISARTNILLSFAAVSSALIGASAAQNGNAFLGVGSGYLAFVSALLGSHHEIMIAQLTAYQMKLVSSYSAKSPFPTWFEFRPRSLERLGA